MVWSSLFICGLVLWGVIGAVYAMGREVWPAEMPEAVRLVVAPAVASAVTVAHKLLAPDFSALTRAAVLALLVAALDALVLAPVVDRNYAMFRGALAAWLPLTAILSASWVTGAFAPV